MCYFHTTKKHSPFLLESATGLFYVEICVSSYITVRIASEE